MFLIQYIKIVYLPHYSLQLFRSNVLFFFGSLHIFEITIGKAETVLRDEQYTVTSKFRIFLRTRYLLLISSTEISTYVSDSIYIAYFN